MTRTLTSDQDREYAFLCALSGYVAEVSAAVGVGEESCTTDVDPSASVYIALEMRLPRHPERDVALLWDERHGWSVAIETHSGEDLLVVAYVGGALVPEPAQLSRFLDALAGGARPVLTVPPELGCPEDDLLGRLQRYRRDLWAAGAGRLGRKR
ncbi:DUF6292 family protein [Amycolatopsis sp. FDAARGOS 1241]|uniref:DUF6292 family protein n=1 Tax=Amycolatopsis sp. FDAARGOS 1241 TaxID=2778070 RepID=UPI001EF3B402|nr:DUF6292 family protein [Amycolatopsis sp. FDAARGOS 1241]